MSLDDYLAQLDARGAIRWTNARRWPWWWLRGEIAGGEQPAGKVAGCAPRPCCDRRATTTRSRRWCRARIRPAAKAFASEQIRREVDALKKAGKPVVVSMGDLAASGGYWISMDADRIGVGPSTISGSIGIFGLVPNFTRTLDKLGGTPTAWAPPGTPARST